jgi:D-alanine-D-alanine ligase
MKICVLQVSYEGSTFEYQYDDIARDLSHFLPEHTFHHEFLKKTTTFRQIRNLRSQDFDIYVNLCEGYLDTDIPSIDVILALEHFNLPYTGPNLSLYSPPKDIMKLVAQSEGIACPDYVVTETTNNLAMAISRLRFPMFVKPNDMGDSLGIDRNSLVNDSVALEHKVKEITEEYGSTLIEEYVNGREFSVLVCGCPDPALPPIALLPIEFRFPEGERFKTYDLKIRQVHPECNVPCDSPELTQRLKEAACKVFSGFSGEGYARMDFRLSNRDELFFLDANFTCSIFYPPGYEGSADYILRFDGMGQAGFLKKIIEEGLSRHARKQKSYVVRSARIGKGVFSSRNIACGEVIFPGEQCSHRLVTRSYVERNWSQADIEIFNRYAYPVGKEVYVLWDREPAGWTPQNHSCDPNTGFSGLDIVAIRDIDIGEELTIDYTTFYDEHMTSFNCQCGSPKCRGRIQYSSQTKKSNPTNLSLSPEEGESNMVFGYHLMLDMYGCRSEAVSSISHCYEFMES